MAESYPIWQFVALESELQTRKLMFITMHYRAFGSLKCIETPTFLWVPEEKVLYLTDGNHRGSWYSLHGMTEMEAEPDKKRVSSFDLQRYKETRKLNFELGIKSPVDLARRVREEDRKHYSMKGPLLPGVLSDDLLKPDFMQNINPNLLHLL